MDWLSTFGRWLLVSQAGLFVGSALIWLGLLVLGGFLVWRYGDVQMGSDPEPQAVVQPPLRRALPTAPILPNYERTDEMFALAGAVVEALDAIGDAITVEMEIVDPLADAIDTELIDYSTPLFYTIRRPKRFELETFTEGITRAQIERALAGGGPDAP